MKEELVQVLKLKEQTDDPVLHKVIDHVLNNDHSKVLSYNDWNDFFNSRSEWSFNLVSFYLRSIYTTRFSWFLITSEVVAVLTKQFKGKRVADLGCGSGYLSNLLKRNEVDITGFDCNTGYEFEYNNDLLIINDDYTKTNLDEYDVLILGWPNYVSDAAYKVLCNVKPHQTVYYQGEGYGGCCADDNFHELLNEKFIEDDNLTTELNKKQLRFSGIHDYWSVYTLEQDELINR